MKVIKQILLLLSAVKVLLFTACIHYELPEREEVEKEPAIIALSLSNVQTRAGNLYADYDLISKVRIYLFDGNYVNAMQVYTADTEEFQNPFRIKTTAGPKTIYVVANEPNDMSAALDAVTTLEGLKKLNTPERKSPLAMPLTMIGSETVTVDHTVDPGPYTTVTIKLTRLATMLNLKVKKGAEAEANNIPIVMKAVRLFRVPAKSALIEGQTVEAQSYWDHTYTGKGDIELTTEGVDAWTGATPMYLYENPGSVNDTTNRATYIIIDASYNGVDTRYYAYINDANSDAVDHHYSTKRNHQYNLIATINNIGEFDGLTLSTVVDPWKLWVSEVLFARTFTLEPHPTAADHIYTVNETTDLVTFTFKLTNPINAKWKAQLSDPTNFEFSTANGAVTSGDVGKEYSISIKPRNPQSRTEKSTEFYIMVGNSDVGLPYAEIPLIKGSVLIGDNNRVVIHQPALPN